MLERPRIDIALGPVSVETLVDRIYEHLRDATGRQDRVRALWLGFLAALRESEMLPEATHRRALSVLECPRASAADQRGGPELPDSLPDEIAAADLLAAERERSSGAWSLSEVSRRIDDALEAGCDLNGRLFWVGFLLGLHEHGLLDTDAFETLVKSLRLDTPRESVELCLGDVALVAANPELWHAPGNG